MPKKSKNVVTKEILMGDLVRDYPFLTHILMEDYGLHCAGCFANTFDTLEGGAQVHGMSEEEVVAMLEHINQEIATHRV